MITGNITIIIFLCVFCFQVIWNRFYFEVIYIIYQDAVLRIDDLQNLLAFSNAPIFPLSLSHDVDPFGGHLQSCNTETYNMVFHIYKNSCCPPMTGVCDWTKKLQRQSRFDQVPSPFDPSFSSRGSMGGAAGGQGGVPGGVGGPGGSPGMFGSPSQMNPMGRPDRGMMDRRRDAPMQHDDLAEMKRMRRF